MSTTARAAIGVLAIAVAVGLFIVLSGGDDSGDETTPVGQTSETTEPTATTADGAEQGGGSETKPDEPKPQEPAEPEVPTIVVKNGEPVGGVQELEFTVGDRIRFDVESDVAEEVHFHGYDVSMDVSAGGKVSFDVPAEFDGVYEVELEHSVVPIAEITVNPA